MSLKWKISAFEQLSASELYQLLQLRSEVFVVEQNCVYQDLDGKDQSALHLLGLYQDRIVAYARLFAPGKYFELSSIGRVVISREYRDRKWGHDLMRVAITGIHRHFDAVDVEISAQLYLKKFYEFHGFEAVGDTYLEDDIPHIRMTRKG